MSIEYSNETVDQDAEANTRDKLTRILSGDLTPEEIEEARKNEGGGWW